MEKDDDSHIVYVPTVHSCAGCSSSCDVQPQISMKLIVQIVFVDLFPSKVTVEHTVPSKSNKTQALACKGCYEYTVVFFFPVT